MKESKNDIRISCGLSGWFFLILAFGAFSLPWLPLFRIEDCWIEIFLFFLLCGCVFLFFSIVYGMSYVFSDAGIKYYIYGIKYRETNWEDIKSAIFLRTGGRSGAKGVLITLKGGMICHSKGAINKWGVSDDTIGDLCRQNRGLLSSIFRGCIHFIIGSYDKEWESAVQLIQANVIVE